MSYQSFPKPPLIAEPKLLDFEMIQMFVQKSKTFTVRNGSEYHVTAQLIVHDEQWLANFPPELINISPSEVSLEPGKDTVITVTVRPAKTSPQHLYILYNFELDDEEDEGETGTMGVYEKHLVDIVLMGDHTAFKFTDIIMDSTRAVWDAQQCWTMFSISLLNKFLGPQHYIVPEGHVPHISVVTFRFAPAPMHSPQQVFKLHLSNVSELKGYWQILSTPPRTWRMRVQSKLAKFPTTSEFKDGYFTDNLDLLSQIWAKKFHFNPATPNKLPPMLNSARDLGLFEITPMSGSLKSKESCVITIKYSFAILGMHQVSVLLRIFPAIYVWIDITGRTLGPNQSYLQLMNERHMVLHPVSLLDMDPPVQMFWMYNGGNSPSSFSVDIEPFEKLKDNNFGHAVMECLTPKGEVGSKCWSAIKLRFSPLEYTNYMVPLIVQTNNEKVHSEVILHGTAAMNPSLSLRPAATSDIRKFVLFAEGVPVTVSPSHISICHLIPTGDSVSRIIFLTNIHPRNTMKYSWKCCPIEGGGMISLHPCSGRLEPKEEISIKVTIQAGDTAAVLTTMLTCTIEDEAAQVLHEFVLGQWKQHTKTSQLRDSDRNSIQISQNRPEKPEAYTRQLAVSLYVGNVFGQFDNLPYREKSRMGFSGSLRCKCGKDVLTTDTPFTYKGSLFCQRILKDIIWDLVESASFLDFIRQATKRKAPMFEEYADTEEVNESLELVGEEEVPAQQGAELAVFDTSKILEKSIFNILHEMAGRYANTSTKANWFEIPPVQPKALVDVEQHKKNFQKSRAVINETE